MGKHVVDVTLRVADRCDAKECGAQAYIRAILLSGLELLFLRTPWHPTQRSYRRSSSVVARRNIPPNGEEGRSW